MVGSEIKIVNVCQSLNFYNTFHYLILKYFTPQNQSNYTIKCLKKYMYVNTNTHILTCACTKSNTCIQIYTQIKYI